MTPGLFLDLALAPALRLLPSRMDTPEARALIVAIALQESKLLARRQFGGPARSYLQFELSGIRGVLTHRATSALAAGICEAVDVAATAASVYVAIEYHDVLACVFGRLLLWTLPAPMPGRDNNEEAWQQYLAAWRPGKPRSADWSANFARAWALVEPRTS